MIFEPVRAVELVGPALVALAGAGALLLLAAVALAIRTTSVTIGLERAWLRSATAFDFDPPAGIPAYAIDSPAPIVALVGVLSPKLLAARAVIGACSQHELANIVAHEHGHFRSMDNLKRWFMTCAPCSRTSALINHLCSTDHSCQLMNAAPRSQRDGIDLG